MSDFNIDFIKIKRDSNLEKLIISVDTFSLTNFAECRTCFTKTHKTSIYLLLTYRKPSFQLTQATETETGDAHLLVSTIMKTQAVCLKPKKIVFRDYKHFDEQIFWKICNLRNLQICKSPKQ